MLNVPPAQAGQPVLTFPRRNPKMPLRLRSAVSLSIALVSAWALVVVPNLLAAEEAAPAAPAAKVADPLDWPNWRGPEQSRVSREKGLPEKFEPEEGAEGNLLWKSTEAAGISTPIVMNGRLYSLVRHAPDSPLEAEKVVCLDAVTGKKLWEELINVYLSDVPAERVGWSSVVGDPTTGRVYAQGVCGHFVCLEGDTGKPVWSKSLHEEFGLLSTYGGRTNFPLVFEDLVIVSGVMTNWGEQSVPAHRLLGLNKNTGEVVWFNGTQLRPEDTTYSTPAIGVVGGQQIMVFGSGDGGVWGFQPRTGKPLWEFQLSIRGNDASPVIDDGVVYMGTSEENFGDSTMGSVLAINPLAAADPNGKKIVTTGGQTVPNITGTGEIWRIRERMVGKCSLCVVDDPKFGKRVYAADMGGKLYVLDAKTGEDICKPVKLIGTIMRSSPLYADGKLYLTTTSGWHVLEPTANGVKFLQKLRLNEQDEVSASPVVSHGRIYLNTLSNLYCIGTPDQKPSADPLPAPTAEAPVSEDPKAALLELSPAESLVAPGDKLTVVPKFFNARGQVVQPAGPVKFALQGPGSIDDHGVYTPDPQAGHAGVVITARSGELSSQARVRVVPPLPWQFDFDATPLSGPKSLGEAPLTWIGARHRHVVRDVDGQRVLVKVTTIPKGTRSQGWMGPHTMHDYTIQADVRGARTNNKLPDIGLIAQGYILDMMGEAQQLQIRTWSATLRNAKMIPFRWEPGVWYTSKLRAEAQGDKAVLKGKVWKRGEPEPKGWMVEAIDDSPNLTGSPGLFGNAQVAEIYYDNVRVTPND